MRADLHDNAPHTESSEQVGVSAFFMSRGTFYMKLSDYNAIKEQLSPHQVQYRPSDIVLVALEPKPTDESKRTPSRSHRRA